MSKLYKKQSLAEIVGESLADMEAEFLLPDSLDMVGQNVQRSDSKSVLTPLELQAVKALIAFVAYTQKAQEDTVASMVCASFDCERVKDLPSQKYASIMEHILTLDVHQSIN